MRKATPGKGSCWRRLSSVCFVVVSPLLLFSFTERYKGTQTKHNSVARIVLLTGTAEEGKGEWKTGK